MTELLRRPSQLLGWASVVATLALLIAFNAFRGATPTRLISPAQLQVVDGWWVRLSPLYALAFAIVGALIVARRLGNRVGWVACGIGLLTAVYQFGLGYSTFGRYMNHTLPGLGFVEWLLTWEWAVPVVLMLFFLPLLFPTGEPISPRWWLLVPLAVGGFALAFVSYIGQLLGLVASVLGTISLIIRFRRAGADERQQIRWFFFAGLVLLVVAFSGVIVGALVYHNKTVVFNPIFDVLTPLAFTGLALSIGVAILRYHLYDIDVFLRQALVYGTLVVLISVLYFITVVSVGSRLGAPRNDPAGAVAIGAIVALLFQPVRRWLQRAANRLVYGKRATPYEVLSRFSEQMSTMYATEDLPVRMAQVLAEGTGANPATVWLRVGSELRQAASWPAGGNGATAVALLDGGEMPAIADATEAVPVRYQGELLGALAVAKREPMTQTERRLLGDLSRQSGPVLKNARLTAELVQRLNELQASRQRLVTAQDTERRRLERNLHDGAQQNLVALKLKIALAKRLTASDPQKAQAALDELTGETNDAIETLRELARGLYPPVLAQEGLAAAIESHTRRLSLPVEVLAGPLHRYPQETEASVYFCVLEALQNVVKHSGASKATVRIDETDGRLVFSVSDDGHGLDPAKARSGSGMQNMRDRVEVLGGTLQVKSSPEKGTRVGGSIPVGQPKLA